MLSPVTRVPERAVDILPWRPGRLNERLNPILQAQRRGILKRDARATLDESFCSFELPERSCVCQRGLRDDAAGGVYVRPGIEQGIEQGHIIVASGPVQGRLRVCLADKGSVHSCAGCDERSGRVWRAGQMTRPVGEDVKQCAGLRGAADVEGRKCWVGGEVGAEGINVAAVDGGNGRAETRIVLGDEHASLGRSAVLVSERRMENVKSVDGC